MSHFHIGEEQSSGMHDCAVVLLPVSGEIDYEASPHLRVRIIEQIEAGARHLVIDLSAVTFIDSMAIGVLVGAVTKLRDLGGSVRVVCVEENERVMRIFDIAGVAGLIALHRSREEALSTLASSRPGEVCVQVDQAPVIVDTNGPSTPAPGPAVARRYAEEATAAGEEQSSSADTGSPGSAVDELA